MIRVNIGTSKNILAVCLLAAGVAGCNSYEITGRQAEAFMKFFGSYREDIGMDVQQDDDGGYVLAGTWTTGDKGRQMCLIRTDRYGNEVWSQLFGNESDDFGNALLVEENGYVLVGTSRNAGGESDIMMVRTDKQGNALSGFPVTLDIDGNEEGLGIEVSEQYGYAIVGFADNPPVAPKGGNDAFFVLVDGSGDIVTTRSHGAERDDLWTSIARVGSQYLLLGQSLYPATRNDAEVMLYLVDGTGALKNPRFIGTARNDIGEAIVLTSSSEGVIVGTSTSADGTQSSVFLASVGVDLNLLSVNTQVIPVSAPEQGSYTGVSAAVTDQGNYVIAGTQTQTDDNIYLLGLDTGGSQMFYRTFGRTGEQSASKFRITGDGGFIIVGSNGFEGNSMITLLKTGPDGSME